MPVITSRLIGVADGRRFPKAIRAFTAVRIFGRLSRVPADRSDPGGEAAAGPVDPALTVMASRLSVSAAARRKKE